MNTVFLSKNHLKSGPLPTMIEAVKVELADDLTESPYHPDIFVTCGHLDDNTHMIDHAKTIIKLLFLSTSRNDRVDKLVSYKSIPSIEESVYVAQDRVEISIVRRSERLKRHHLTTLDWLVHLELVDLTIRKSASYQTFTFSDDVGRLRCFRY